MINVFIGYDPNEILAYHVLCHSILTRTSEPVTICPININSIPEYTRPRDPKQSTEFSFSRFLVPWLMGYQGDAIFMDCDMLVLGDIADLLIDDYPTSNGVSVVQHDYTPSTKTKFLGQEQTVYPKKNWSSVMVFDCAHPDCRRLTPEAVNTESGKWLHQFEWAYRVGAISPKWNYLVGEGQEVKDPKLIHYTIGGPWFNEYSDCEYSTEWFAELESMYALQDVRWSGVSEVEAEGHTDSEPVPREPLFGGVLPFGANGV